MLNDLNVVSFRSECRNPEFNIYINFNNNPDSSVGMRNALPARE